MNGKDIDNNAKVTVVMAVYNAAKTLDYSIGSVINQTYPYWELICINDGSTDRSLEILNNFRNKDNRITVVSKENGGPALARSLGYEMSSTPYVTILDSDDALSPDYLEKAMLKADETGADAIVPNALIEQADGSFMDWNKRFCIDTTETLTGNQAFARTFIQASMHGLNLWRNELVKKYGIVKSETDLPLNADEYAQRLMFLHSKTICFSEGHYIYKNNTGSITKAFSMLHLGYLKTCKKLIDLAEDKRNKIEPALISHIKENYLRTIIALQIRYNKNKKALSTSDRKTFRNEIRSNYKSALRYKSDCTFRDKRLAGVYRTCSLNGYPLFILTCRIMAYIK